MQFVIQVVLDHLQLLAIIAGFVGTFITIRRQTRVFQTYVALEFFRRYAEISKAMPDRLRLAKYIADTSPISDEEQRSIIRSMIEYGNLCSEEFALWEQGRVPAEIWEIWTNGIAEHFETEIWREAWAQVSPAYESYKPFIGFMNQLVQKAEQTATKKQMQATDHWVEDKDQPRPS